MAKHDKKCKHCGLPAIAILDGEPLCQHHADEWVRAEAHTPYKRARDEDV